MKKPLILGIVLLAVFAFSACSPQKDNVRDMSETEENAKKKEHSTEKTETEEKNLEDNLESPPENESTGDKLKPIKLNIYYPDSASGELISKSVEVEKIDAQIIWKELQQIGVAAEGTGVLGVEIDGDGQSMTLDLNEVFGNQIRGMGTTGENETLNSIVNTYLEAYQCQKIKITEEGGILTSGHKEYGDYLERR